MKSPLGDTPKAWSLARLGDITRKIGSGATPLGGEQVYLPRRHEYALIRSQAVHDNFLDLSSLSYIADEDAHRLANAVVQPGDVLLNITGDGVTFARASLAPEEALPACVNQHVCIIRSDPNKLIPGFLLSYLTHPDIKGYIESFNAGGSRRAITKGHIESFVIPLPPLMEQKAIASLLESLNSKIELNRKMNQALEMTARSLFKDWFEDFGPVKAKEQNGEPYLATRLWKLFPDQLGSDGAPDGWTFAELASITSELRRGISPKYVVDGGIRVLNQKCIRGRTVNTAFARRHDPTEKSVDGRDVHPGDILVNSTGVGTLGRVAQIWTVDETTVVDSHVTVVRPDQNRTTPIYLGMNLMGREFEIEMLGEGSTGQTELSRARLGKLSILLPDNKVLSAFDETVGPLVQRIASNQSESEILARTRDLLLPALTKGEIRVNHEEKQIEDAS